LNGTSSEAGPAVTVTLSTLEDVACDAVARVVRSATFSLSTQHNTAR
jgi:hypothetical protein